MNQKNKPETKAPKVVTLLELPYRKHPDHQDVYAYGTVIQNTPQDVVIHFGIVDYWGDTGKTTKQGSGSPVFLENVTVRMPPQSAASFAVAMLEHIQKNADKFQVFDKKSLVIERIPPPTGGGNLTSDK